MKKLNDKIFFDVETKVIMCRTMLLPPMSKYDKFHRSVNEDRDSKSNMINDLCFQGLTEKIRSVECV